MLSSLLLVVLGCAGVEHVHRDLGDGKAFVMTTISDPNAFMSSIQRNYAEVCDMTEDERGTIYTNCKEAGAEYIVSETGWFAGLFTTVATVGTVITSAAIIAEGLAGLDVEANTDIAVQGVAP